MRNGYRDEICHVARTIRYYQYAIIVSEDSLSYIAIAMGSLDESCFCVYALLHWAENDDALSICAGNGDSQSAMILE